MNLKFNREDGGFRGLPVGGGFLSPGRVGGAPGLRWRTQFANGGSVGSASKRADGCAKKGKTKGKMY